MTHSREREARDVSHCPTRGPPQEQPRGAEGWRACRQGRGAACSRRRIPARLRAAEAEAQALRGGRWTPEGAGAAGGARVGGPAPADWLTAGETLPHAAGSDWPSGRKG